MSIIWLLSAKTVIRYMQKEYTDVSRKRRKARSAGTLLRWIKISIKSLR